MEPLGADSRGMIPFRDKVACDHARAVRREQVTWREPIHHPEFRIRVVDDPGVLHDALAEDMLSRMTAAWEERRPFVGLFPIGPVGQYPRLVERAVTRRADLSHCTLFFLDEYAYEDGSTVNKRSPWSFENAARKTLIEPIVAAGLRPPAFHLPGPDNIAEYAEMIAKASEGRGADVVYGGIGWCGHFAFWEPHLAEEFASEEEWKRAHSAFVRLHPMSLLYNSLRAGGDWSSVPPCAYTVSPNVVLGRSTGASGWMPTWVPG